MRAEFEAALQAARRLQFFNYFRKRLETVGRKDLPLPDRLILITACLDAMASHWHRTADPIDVPRHVKGDERLRQFLVRHGHHDAFSRVSAPLIRNVSGKEVGAFPFHAYTAGELNAVTDWRDDPTFSDLPAVGPTGKLRRRWSYPGILYVDLRCAWVHRFAPDNADVSVVDENSFERAEPFYRLVLHSVGAPTFMLVIPYPFLLATLESAINSFEQEATTRDIVPFD